MKPDDEDRRPPRRQSSMTERFEAIVRENERLRTRLADLEPAVGHAAVLVQLARAVRSFRQTQSTEDQLAMFTILDQYDRRRSHQGEPDA